MTGTKSDLPGLDLGARGRELLIGLLCAGLPALAIACGDSGSGTNASDSDPSSGETTAGTAASESTDSTSGSGSDAGTGTSAGPTSGDSDSDGSGGDTADIGGDCVVNLDCKSFVCEKFTTATTGECVEPPADGNTRFMGTVRNIIDGSAHGGATIRVLAAIDALSDPTMATPLFEGTADGGGVYDFQSSEPVNAAIGIIGLMAEAGFYPTATGLAKPVSGNSYGPAGDVFDLWVIPDTELAAWNAMLEMDGALTEHVPLGEKGGVIGIVRGATGDPMAGAVVESKVQGSGAIIRYLAADGMSFTSDMTSDNGLFILVNPGLAEEFTVAGTEAVGTAGSAATGAVFVMALNVL